MYVKRTFSTKTRDPKNMPKPSPPQPEAAKIKIIFLCEYCFEGYVKATDLIAHKREKHIAEAAELVNLSLGIKGGSTDSEDQKKAYTVPVVSPIITRARSRSGASITPPPTQFQNQDQNEPKFKADAAKNSKSKTDAAKNSKPIADAAKNTKPKLTQRPAGSNVVVTKKLHQVLRFKPKTVQCKYCSQTFTNKLLAIRHELVSHGSSFPIKIEPPGNINVHADADIADPELISSSSAPIYAITPELNSSILAKPIETDTDTAKSLLDKDKIPTPNTEDASGASKPNDNTTEIKSRSLKIKKLFPCIYCTKMYRSKQFRDEHQGLHTGQKPYACRHCSLAFIFSTTRCNHEKICPRKLNSKISNVKVKRLSRYPQRTNIQPNANETSERTTDVDAVELPRLLETNITTSESGNGNFGSDQNPITAPESENQNEPSAFHLPDVKPDILQVSFLPLPLTSMNPTSICKVEYDMECNNTHDPTSEQVNLLPQVYKCTFCPVEFKLMEDRLQHEKSHSNTSFFECLPCNLNFVSPAGLSAHVRKRHSKNGN